MISSGPRENELRFAVAREELRVPVPASAGASGGQLGEGAENAREPAGEPKRLEFVDDDIRRGLRDHPGGLAPVPLFTVREEAGFEI